MDDMELSGEEVDGTLADLMADRPRRTAIYEYRDSSTEIPTCLSRLEEREKKKKEEKNETRACTFPRGFAGRLIARRWFVRGFNGWWNGAKGRCEIEDEQENIICIFFPTLILVLLFRNDPIDGSFYF